MKIENKLICNLCHKEIDISKNYTHLEDWRDNSKLGEVWCHSTCFQKGMNRELNGLEKMAKDMLAKSSRVLDSKQFDEMFPKKEKEFIIT